MHQALSASIGMILLVLASVLAAPAAAEKRVAFIVGNGKYAHAAELPNPKNDAGDVAAALKRSGFEVILGIDLDQHAMRETSIRFAKAARDADVAMFYYAGHAIQFNGVNYLIPVDSRLRDEADLRRMLRVDEVVADLQQAKNLRILVLDACRDNPLAETLKRAIGRTRAASVQQGLAKIDSPEGMIVSYATQAGLTAEDGRGRNSPYTAAFLKHIETRAEIGTVFRRMSADVYAATGKKQLPELSLSLIGEFYLHGKPESATAAASPLPAPDPAAVAWETVKNTKDAQLVKDYLDQYSEGIFAALARSRLRSLTEKKVAGLFPVPPKLTVDTVKPGEEMQDCDQCPLMIAVPAGSFTMGSAAGRKGRDRSEGPQRQVTLARPFAVSKFEISFDEWEACALEGGCNGYKPKDSGWGRGRRPAIHVSWDDAKAYVQWLGQKTGKPYRLLSEAEWEYAARGGTTGAYAFGSAITPQQANYDGSVAAGSSGASYRGKTVEVGSFAPNPFGLHDMHGNVMEWVEDCWNPDHSGAPADASPRGGDCTRRVLKGGAWYYEADYLRSAARQSYPAATRLNVVGFRVARTLQ